jgi:rhodanese-related sulfurtransferase
MSQIPNTISPLEFQERLTAHPGLTVLDVRTPDEFAEVHVPQSHNEPLDKLKPDTLFAAGRLISDEPVYLLSRTGGRATEAAGKFATAGGNPTIIIKGGILAWIESGLPITRGSGPVISLERQVRITAGALVVIGVGLGWFVHRGFYGLSAFIGAGLVFAGITDICGLCVVLAKLPWNKRKLI